MRANGGLAARLESAIGTGEVIGIVYHGGSQPGSLRDILPLQVKGGSVRAKCLSTGAAKTFLLAKIELRPTSTSPSLDAAYSPGHVASAKFDNMAEVYAAIRPELEAAGWSVTFEVGADGDHVAAFGRFKNGKTRKAASAGVTYSKVTWDLVAQLDGTLARQNIRPRQRPWTVFSKTLPTARAFASADKAVETLLIEIKKLSSVG